MFVKKGDKVKVITGKDRNKEGIVLEAFPKKDRVIVEGVNMIKKHQKPNNAAPQGGILEKEASIHVSNVALVDPKTGEATKVSYKVIEGKKVRVSKKSGEVIDNNSEA
ncbi:50S ribosomal protein L24 [Enterococcus timonensis]|uniref:50S ribosomal protein L24 n=1 Tax=Enterococcus timonensis TaxID=1852364 RepID=UPI0008DAB6CB|nr:50S ribosomal protein L24 [Enterococcus timonensis]